MWHLQMMFGPQEALDYNFLIENNLMKYHNKVNYQ